MKGFRIAIGAGLIGLAMVAEVSHGGVVFGKPKLSPGQRVRLKVLSEAKGGSLETRGPDGNSSARMDVVREREIVWTIMNPAPEGMPRVMVRIPKFVTISTLTINGVPDVRTTASPLIGKLVEATKKKDGSWVFVSDGSPIGGKAKEETRELAAYQNSDWFPDREVQVGESWEFEPRWIKLVLQRDLRDALVVGSMTLREVRRTMSAQSAVVDMIIRSSGTKTDEQFRETTASLELKGRAVVNLKTMLYESLELAGNYRSQVSDGAKRTILSLPLRMTASQRLESGGEPASSVAPGGGMQEPGLPPILPEDDVPPPPPPGLPGRSD
jgi:hypothetical protein